MAKVTIAFDAWKEGKVGPTNHEIPIVLSKMLDLKLQTVSTRLVKELIHPNKSSGLDGIRFNANSKRLIAGDYPGGVVAVWDVETAKRITTIETGYGYRGSGHYFFITPDWKTLFVSRPGKRKIERIEKDGKQVRQREFDGNIRAWDLTTGELKRTYQHDPPRYILNMALAPDGSKFFTSEWLPGIFENSPNNAATLWDVKTGKFIDLGKNVGSYSTFAPDGKTMTAATQDKDGHTTALRLLDTSTGKEKRSIPVKEKNARASIGFSPDGKLILAGYRVLEKAGDWKNYQYRLEFLEATTGKKVASLAAAKNEALATSFAPDGQTLAAYNFQGQPKLLLFSIPENRVLKTIALGTQAKGERVITRQPAFSPDGKQLAIITHAFPDTRDLDPDPLDIAQPRIHLIDVLSGQIRETLVAPQGFSMSLCFSPDGRTLAVGGHGRVLLFDVSGPTR
jgi:WD40 repeat protein